MKRKETKTPKSCQNGTLAVILTRRFSDSSELAREVAAWICDRFQKKQTIAIVGADLLLDTALANAGLPLSGARTSAESGCAALALLTLLPLMAESIPHPERVLEYLLLPRVPVPFANGLADALHKWPAIHSPAWTETLDRIEEHVEPEIFSRFREKLEDVFSGAPLDTVSAFKRCLLALREDAGHRSGDGMPGAEDWRRLFMTAGRLLSALEPLPEDQVLSLRTWCQMVLEVSAAVSSPAFPAGAGLVFVDHPGQLIAPADVVIWWNFTDASEPAQKRVETLPGVRRALAAAGIDVAAVEQSAIQLRKESWFRAASAARDTLMLVSPKQDAGGETMQTHPALDFFRQVAAVPDAADHLMVPGEHTGTFHMGRPLRELPVRILPRETESPSGLESLFSCPMKWTLNYKAHLQRCRARPLPEGSLLRGNVFHHLIEVMNLCHDPERMASEFDRVFQEQVPRLAALWSLPGGQSEAQNARAAYLRTVRELAHLLPADSSIVASETEQERVFDGKTLKGRIDLLLQNPVRVLDFKTGAGKREQELRDGASVQLLAYALLMNPETPPSILFMIINHARLLPGPEGREVSAADQSHVLNTWSMHLDALAQGRIRAAGIPEGADEVLAKAQVENGIVCLPPGCRYCSFDRICGRKPVLEEKA